MYIFINLTLVSTNRHNAKHANNLLKNYIPLRLLRFDFGWLHYGIPRRNVREKMRRMEITKSIEKVIFYLSANETNKRTHTHFQAMRSFSQDVRKFIVLSFRTWTFVENKLLPITWWCISNSSKKIMLNSPHLCSLTTPTSI